MCFGLGQVSAAALPAPAHPLPCSAGAAPAAFGIPVCAECCARSRDVQSAAGASTFAQQSSRARQAWRERLCCNLSQSQECSRLSLRGACVCWSLSCSSGALCTRFPLNTVIFDVCGRWALGSAPQPEGSCAGSLWGHQSAQEHLPPCSGALAERSEVPLLRHY